MVTEKYTSDFSEDIRKLENIHARIDAEIRDVWKQIKTVEQKYISSKSLDSKRDKVKYARSKVQKYAEMRNYGILETEDADKEEI